MKGTTVLVSINSKGTGPASTGGVDGTLGVNSFHPLISGNGRFVAFSTWANNLVPNKTDILVQDIFVRDLESNKTVLVSANLDGNDKGRKSNDNSVPHAISYDGRFVVFDSFASDLYPGDTNNLDDSFVRDIVRGKTEPLNLRPDGTLNGDFLASGRISYDGRRLVFASLAPDLVPNDANNNSDVFSRLLFQGNPIDDAHFFVRRHYLDFLNREPDAAGQAFWTSQLESCGNDPLCLDRKRVDVSAAFFLSIEFQNTGYLIHRFHAASFADSLPRFQAFLDDLRRVGDGVVVGQAGWEAKLEANKRAFAVEWVRRPAFVSQFPMGMQAAEYVAKLFANARTTPTETERGAAIAAYGSGDDAGRAAALRSAAESASLYARQYNEAFVLMQYFGYLRRNPDDPPDGDLSGFNFWLRKLNDHSLPGEDVRDPQAAHGRALRAEMVKSFLVSGEYRARFTR